MSWLINLIKGNSLIAGAISLGLAAGGWLTYAELCHAQQREDHKTVAQLVQIQRDAAIEKAAEAKQQKAKQEYIKAGCLSGKIKDIDDCAEVGVKLL